MRRSGTNEGGARDRKTHYKTVEESVKDKARAKLRLQVQDFVAWLKKNR